jgi:hypothetical protein
MEARGPRRNVLRKEERRTLLLHVRPNKADFVLAQLP